MGIENQTSADTSAETLDTKPSHYHTGKYDVMELQDWVMTNYVRKLETESINQIPAGKLWAIGSMVKHMMRLGLKDDVDIELKKIQNYACYARTGKWMEDDE